MNLRVVARRMILNKLVEIAANTRTPENISDRILNFTIKRDYKYGVEILKKAYFGETPRTLIEGMMSEMDFYQRNVFSFNTIRLDLRDKESFQIVRALLVDRFAETKNETIRQHITVSQLWNLQVNLEDTINFHLPMNVAIAMSDEIIAHPRDADDITLFSLIIFGVYDFMDKYEKTRQNYRKHTTSALAEHVRPDETPVVENKILN